MNDTPLANRVHIGFFGRRNAGKSSLVNAVTGQSLAVVSDVEGTTTDPVTKAMELLPLGPVVIIDTPGLDDEGELGMLRVKKSYQMLNKTDIAVVVIDSIIGVTDEDRKIIELINKKSIPLIVAYNKVDTYDEVEQQELKSKLTASLAGQLVSNEIIVSASTGYNIDRLKEMIAENGKVEENKLRIIGDLINPSDFVVLVVPIDKAAPKGRLILPQQQTIRDILESDATAIVVKEYELRDTLMNLGKKPKVVITDSQVFAKVSADTPLDVYLTSFSILFARYKGNLEENVRGAKAIDELKDGDTVLISEGCTHHRQCDDIGTVKIPRWIRNYTHKNLNLEYTSGTEFPSDLSKYSLIIHCGGCMLNEREMKYRLDCAKDQNIPMTNYGIAIAYMQGILKRSLGIFPGIHDILE